MDKEIAVKATELIVTKTDLKGKITYANRHFMRIANYSEVDLLGQNHNVIRHADMPRGVFFGLWENLKKGSEFFGFIKNATSDGNYYWVFANVTPDVIAGEMVGYYSVRRLAPPQAISIITDIYSTMRSKESSQPKGNAPESSWKWLSEYIHEQHGLTYEQYVLSLYKQQL